jgi:tetratricopeptide (TPR) repeat protein
MRFYKRHLLVVTLGVSLAARAASGEDRPSAGPSSEEKALARKELRQGNTAYNIGQWDEAAAHFQEGYRLVQEPSFHFNLAQSYRMAGKLERAMQSYQAFLRTAPARAPNRGLAERFVEELRRRTGEKTDQPAALTPPPPGSQVAPAAVGDGSRPTASPTAPIAVVYGPTPSRNDTLTTNPAATAGLTAPAPATSTNESASARPFYKTWWFWTGAAAVVAAGTVTAFVLAYRSNDRCSGASLTCVEVK